MKKLFILMLLTVLLVGTVSASIFATGVHEDVQGLEYGRYLIKDYCIPFTDICFSGTVQQITLEENDGEGCGRYCSAYFELQNVKDNLPLALDIDFWTIKEDGSRVKQPIRNYQFYIKTGVETIEVEDYEWQCIDTGEISSNGTAIQECSNVLIGTHEEETEEWQPYTLGTRLPKGKYNFKIEGEKKPDRIVDWVLNFDGNVKSNEWAVWGTNSIISDSDLVSVFKLTDNSNSINISMNLSVLDGQIVFNSSVYKDGTSGTFGTSKSMLVDNSNTNVDWQLANTNGNTLSFWLYSNSISSNKPTIFNKRAAGSGWYIYYENTGDNKLTIDGLSSQLKETSAHITNTWYNYIILTNSSSTCLFKNGVLQQCASKSLTNGNTDINIGDGTAIGETNFDGNIDEIYLFKKALNQSEIENVGIGTYYPFTYSSINLNSPEDNYISSTPEVTFNATATVVGGATLTNMSLWTNKTGSWEISNTTTLTGTTNTSILSLNLNEGSTLWSIQACDSDGDCGFSENRTVLVDASPPTITISKPTTLLDYGSVGGTFNLSWVVSDSNLDSIWYNYNGTNITLSGTTNSTLVTIPNYGNRTLTLYANDSIGNLNSSTRNWDYRVWENSKSLNTSTYETAYESYSINVTSNASLTAVDLVYNGTDYAMTNSGGVWSYGRNIPTTSVGNNSIYFDFTYAGSSIVSTNTSQNVGAIMFGLCNATLTVPFVNYTFVDEDTSLNINGSMNSVVTYYLGTGSVNKSSTYVNAAYNPSYAFCFTPADKTVKTLRSLQYSADGYPTRKVTDFSSKSYTNTTTNSELYLLPTGSGIYTTFQIINYADQNIVGAKVNATTASGLVDSSVTDDSGSITFWLDPDTSTTINVDAAGYSLYTTSLFPTQSSYTITIGDTTPITTPDYTRGISYTLLPLDLYLYNNTGYHFNFTLSSTYWTVTSWGINVTNSSNYLLDQTSSAANGGFLDLNVNTGNETSVILNAWWIIDGNITTIRKIFPVQDSSGTGYSLFNLFNRLTEYLSSDEGIFGLKKGISMNIFIFLLIFVSTGILSYKFGVDEPMIITSFLFVSVLFFDVILGLIYYPEIIPNNTATIMIFLVLVIFGIREVSR